MKKNIVLLGGSSFFMQNGIQEGLRQGSLASSKEEIFIYNYAIGATTSIQNLCELVRRQKVLKTADLIITNSNINDSISVLSTKEQQPIEILYRNLFLYYQELHKLKKIILVLITPFDRDDIRNKFIINIHRGLIKYFGFNFIDMYEYYEHHNLFEFGKRRDTVHEFDFVMRELGRNIIKNLKSFFISQKNVNHFLQEYYFLPAKELEVVRGNVKKIHHSNFSYGEDVVRIETGDIVKIPDKYYNYQIIALHTWNNHIPWDEKWQKLDQFVLNYSSIEISNLQNSVIKETNSLINVLELHKDFIIKPNTYIKLNTTKKCEELYHHAYSWHDKAKNNNFCDIVGFLLVSKPIQNFQIKFDILSNQTTYISKKQDFGYLMPPVEWYKEIIDEYCSVMDPKKLTPLQNQINTLKSTISLLEQSKNQLSQEKREIQEDNLSLKHILNSLSTKKQQLEISILEQDLINKKLQNKQLLKILSPNIKTTTVDFNSAKFRIHNQLSYKLGQAMIVNSKTFLGYIRMPFVLSYIKDKHKQGQKIYQEKIQKDPSLKLPPLESYPDYKEALKEKECLTYKLGQALIKANKTWYRGGYIGLLFEIKKLKKE
ncbi:SGNH/GDSL hydrolase family protein [Campylobacter sp. LMG 17559]|uniref:SGNH/GDSL hydrolase family protein n=1 Tax=Campylobacter sp. LMG 17559 TaxID=2735748 RepID=UPI00301DE9F3|nr:hypothetical protein [Campylobacter sp. LMG 17559]